MHDRAIHDDSDDPQLPAWVPQDYLSTFPATKDPSWHRLVVRDLYGCPYGHTIGPQGTWRWVTVQINRVARLQVAACLRCDSPLERLEG